MSPIYAYNHTMTLTEKYQNQLDLVRQNPNLLDNYRFDKDAPNSNHFERLRLNIAIYNDFKQTDFELVKFLFNQEKEWRKVVDDGEVYNLYFCAFVLTFFNKPEIIWAFFEAKHIDFDSGCGFDGEFLVAVGIEKTYAYLQTTTHPDSQAMLKYTKELVEESDYTDEHIEEWKAHKREYFRGLRISNRR